MTKYQGIFLLCFCSSSVWATSLVDPTRPQNNPKKMGVEEQNKELLLSAVFITANSKQAIINGLSYSEGQAVLAYKVVSIRPNEVELIGPQGRQSLFINNNNIKKDADNGF
jgi:MSHA biogenesis protein MshK